MASRKDELNAYTFAKRRTVAAFLQPSPTGTEEGAPKPLRAVLPGLVVAALITAGFGAWGIFRPAVPQDWDAPGENVIVASDSTTRYVVLNTDGRAQLHPVLNLASARLLLDGGDFDIVNVDEAELDSGDVPHGATLGIPYAPDRLPSAEEAGVAMRWAVCQQPGGGDGDSVQQAVFLLADREADAVDGRDRLTGGEVLYVRSADSGTSYLVDRSGTRYAVDGGSHDELLRRVLVHEEGPPQPVSEEWLATLHEGSPIDFPELPGTIGEPAGVPGLGQEADRVGMVLRATTGAGPQQYVVLPERVVPVSDFTAHLLLNKPESAVLDQADGPLDVGAQTFTPAPAEESIDREHDWPRESATQVNGALGEEEARDTVCSVLRDVDADDGSTELSTWAGTGYPATFLDGATTAYVTPGSGLLYRQVQGDQADAGGIFLVTDTGLRYSVPSNASGEEANEAQIRLGYGGVSPAPVPAHWSTFLPTGPRLDTESAQLPQGA